MNNTLWAALLMAAMAHGSTHAAAQATTRIDAVTLQAIDLTPDDGSVAGFTIAGWGGRLIAYTDTRPTGGAFDPTTVVPSPAVPASAFVNAGAAHALAATSGAPGDVQAEVATTATLGMDNTVSAESEQRLHLTLGPHTLLTVSGTVLTEAYRTLGVGEGYRVFTWASVDIADTDEITSAWLTRESALIWGEPTAAARNVERFMLAYANPGDAPMPVSLNFLAYADIAVLAVPEPAGGVMLVAGLALCWLARRRSNTAG